MLVFNTNIFCTQNNIQNVNFTPASTSLSNIYNLNKLNFTTINFTYDITKILVVFIILTTLFTFIKGKFQRTKMQDFVLDNPMNTF